MVSVSEIKRLRYELEQAEAAYLSATPYCQNKKCAFFTERGSGNCSWSVLLEDCKEYDPNYTEDKPTEGEI